MTTNATKHTLDLAETCADLRAENSRLREALRGLLNGAACEFDALNPCWDDRPSDIPGKHWGIGDACAVCTARAALAAKE